MMVIFMTTFCVGFQQDYIRPETGQPARSYSDEPFSDINDALDDCLTYRERQGGKIFVQEYETGRIVCYPVFQFWGM